MENRVFAWSIRGSGSGSKCSPVLGDPATLPDPKLEEHDFRNYIAIAYREPLRVLH